MYSTLSELDEIVKDPKRLLEDFQVKIPESAPTVLDTEGVLSLMNMKLSSGVVDYYATVRSGNVPERLPYDVRKGYADDLASRMSGQILHQNLQTVGVYSKITKHMARGLRSLIPANSVVLDPMTGNGMMVKALREAGIMSFGTDNNSHVKTESFEPIDAMDSLARYGDNITHLLLAWPSGSPDFELLQEVRKNYENVQMLVIGEVHGCTGSDKFWDSVTLLDEVYEYETVENLYDRFYFVE